MSIIDAVSLFIIMLTLAAVPSTSVALVVIRSAMLGLKNGVAVAFGIVLGDLIFVILSILGLSFVAETMAGFFIAVKYLGAMYLLWLGYSLLTSKSRVKFDLNKSNEKGSLAASFLSGLFLTLGDVKAIFFYISLFPVFIDLSTLNFSGISLILTITIVTVGGVKIAYAFSANKLVSMSKHLKLETGAKKLAGSFMIGAGAYLMIRA